MSISLPSTAIDWATVRDGDALPDLVIDLTATLIVAGAVATRDFMPVHHDRDYANAQGSPDIFMNILSDTAYCSRYLTDWTGPNAMVRKLGIRLGVPVFPGTRLTYSGVVEDVDRGGDETTVTIAFQATTDLGEHVNGTAVVTSQLP